MRLRNLIGGIAISLFTLCAAPAAFAADPCAGPFPGPDVYISKSGSCNITIPINVSGVVNITATGALKTTSTVSAGGYVYMDGATGTTATMAIQAGSYVDLRSDSGLLNISGAITASGGTTYLQGQTGVKAAAVTASDYVDVRAFAGDITFSKPVISMNNYLFLLGQNIKSTSTSSSLSAGTYIQATDSGIKTINLKGTVKSGTANGGQGGATYLWAQGDIASGPITDVATNAAAQQQNYIDIRANLSGSSSPFIIGGSGNLNGVNGSGPVLVTDTVNGGGVDQTYSHGGVYVKNLAGGITVTAANNISVKATASKSGLIILDARSDTLTLPTGTLSADGAAGQDAGFIVLFANTINAANDTVLSASQQSSAPLSAHGVAIAAGTVNYGGSSQGLAIHADGGGASSSNTAYATLTPTGSAYITEPNPNSGTCYCLFYNGALDSYVGATTYSAASGSILNVTANGSNSAVTFTGYPMSITGGNVTFQSQGATNHQVYVGFYSGGTGSASLTFGNNGATLLDASAGSSPGTGGSVTLNAYTATLSTPTTFTMNANGPTSGNGDGGIVGYYTNGSSTFGSALKGLFEANAASAGTGNGSATAITFYPGNTPIKLGTKAGDFQVLANGGSVSGNAGAIIVNPTASNGNITFDTATAASATVLGTSGQGGNVTLIANPNFAVTANLAGASINVDGKGSGDGGQIKILGNGSLSLGSAAGNLSLSAQNNGGTGSGGTIEIGYSTSLILNSGLTVAAGTASGSDGAGGTINIHDINTLVVGDNTLDASGQGNGKGGKITLNSTGSGVNLSSALINASAGQTSTGTGVGGVFEATSTLSSFDVNGGINVSGGLKVGTTAFDGSISLNGVNCQQWQLTQTTGPTSYWDCVTTGTQSAPGTPATLDTQPSILATSSALNSVRPELATPPSRIYVFATPTADNSFFNYSEAPSNSVGYTTEIGTTTTVYSGIFDSTLSSNQQGYDNAQEITAHELGHAVDYVKTNESVSGPYLTYAAVDYLNLDYTFVGSTQALSTSRDPCTGTGAPYASINDESDGLAFCVSTATAGYTLVPNTSMYIESKYIPGGTLMRNSQIAQVASAKFVYDTTGGWLELYAQTFAWVAYVNGISPTTYYYNYTADNLFKETYFACTRGWASALLAADPTPPSPALAPYSPADGYPACNNLSVTGWYRTLLGH